MTKEEFLALDEDSQEDYIREEFDKIEKFLADMNERQDTNCKKLHSVSESDIADLQEAYSDLIYNDINDELEI